MQDKLLMPGDAAGNYDEKWTKTFDLTFLILWLVLFAFLLTWTLIFDPNLFDERKFFLMTAVKLFVMMILALGGGMLCRHFCNVDEKGYITTSKNKWFKVNYTRKIQHFAAYLVPLLSPPTEHLGILPHLWESLFVLFMFLVLSRTCRNLFGQEKVYCSFLEFKTQICTLLCRQRLRLYLCAFILVNI